MASDLVSEKKLATVGDGTPGPGRPKGLQNRFTKLVKEAILEAAEDHGYDGTGYAGLTGYMFMLAEKYPKQFATLVAKSMPLQISGNFNTGQAPDTLTQLLEEIDGRTRTK